MEHGRDVYVYAYLPQRAVFRTTPENMLFAMVIYLVILAAIRMVRWKTAQSYREEQLAIQKEYTEQLQLKMNSFMQRWSRQIVPMPQRQAFFRA